MNCIREISRRLDRGRRISVLTMAGCLAFAGQLSAQQVSLSGRVGSLGLGTDLALRVSDRVGARVGLNALSFSFNGEEEDIRYEFDVGLLTGTFLGDLYLSQSGFRLTAGVLANHNKLDLEARAQSDLEIGDHTYSDVEVGKLTGRLDFRNASPYIGLGFDSSVRKEKGLGFVVGVGVLLQGSPRVVLEADGPVANDPEFQADLAREEEEIQDDVSFFKVYPAISLGISYAL